jgi:hypothetical protein
VILYGHDSRSLYHRAAAPSGWRSLRTIVERGTNLVPPFPSSFPSQVFALKDLLTKGNEGTTKAAKKAFFGSSRSPFPFCR